MTTACLPNLPENTAKTVLCGDYPMVRNALTQRGIEVLTIRESDSLPVPVRRHADMLCCHAAANTVVTADAELALRLDSRETDCRVTSGTPGSEYPYDIALNCLVIGGFAFGKTDYLAPEVIAVLSENNIVPVNVRQGYTRCSVAVVDEKSVITADKGIYGAMIHAGFDVLLISSGDILLEGYDTGFIGGCCGKISADHILFCGDPALHPDGKKIISFIESRGVKIECTHSGMLTDFGGFITLTE